MQGSIYYCEQCFKLLQEWGELPTCVFETICEFYATQDGCYLIADDPHYVSDGVIQVIDFLEKKGYIVTTEFIDDVHIVAKPTYIAYDADDESWCICVNNKQHEFIVEEKWD